MLAQKWNEREGERGKDLRRSICVAPTSVSVEEKKEGTRMNGACKENQSVNSIPAAASNYSPRIVMATVLQLKEGVFCI